MIKFSNTAFGVIVMIWAIGSLTVSSLGQVSPAEQRGRNFARTNCAACHSIDRVTSSPLADAPPFRTLQQRYPVESLEEALAEGIVTGHPSMPEFKLDPAQIADFLAFLRALK